MIQSGRKANIERIPMTDSNHQSHQTVKTSITHVTNNPRVKKILEETAILMSRITTHTLLFIKLYYLDCVQVGREVPLINQKFVMNVMKTLCVKSKRGTKPNAETEAEKAPLIKFYQDHYKNLLPASETALSQTGLDTVFLYAATGIVTMYNNNIIAHFAENVQRFVNVMFDKQQRIAAIKASQVPSAIKKLQIRTLLSDCRHVKTDLMFPNQPKRSNLIFHDFIDFYSKLIIPTHPLAKGHVAYDVKVHPSRYLPNMLLVNEYSS